MPRRKTYETHVIKNPLLPFVFHPSKYGAQSIYCGLNWHENLEILYCTDGSATIVLDARQYTFAPGTIAIANAYCVHTTMQEKELDYHCLIIDKSFCVENGLDTSMMQFREIIREEQAIQAMEAVVHAYQRYNEEDLCAVADIRHAVLGLLLTLSKHYLAENGQDQQLFASRERVKQVVAYIRNHFAAHISLQDIADAVGISKYHLSREFRKFTGSTVFETINLTRCAEAKTMICQGMPVSEAAFNCGYTNLSYFTRSFKKYIGKKPSAFFVKQHGNTKECTAQKNLTNGAIGHMV